MTIFFFFFFFLNTATMPFLKLKFCLLNLSTWLFCIFYHFRKPGLCSEKRQFFFFFSIYLFFFLFSNMVSFLCLIQDIYWFLPSLGRRLNIFNNTGPQNYIFERNLLNNIYLEFFFLFNRKIHLQCKSSIQSIMIAFGTKSHALKMTFTKTNPHLFGMT